MGDNDDPTDLRRLTTTRTADLADCRGTIHVVTAHYITTVVSVDHSDDGKDVVVTNEITEMDAEETVYKVAVVHKLLGYCVTEAYHKSSVTL